MKKLFLIAMAFLAAFPAHANYRQKAQTQTDFIQAHFWDAAAKKYRDSYPVKSNDLPFTTMWANGVQWSTLVSATRYDPARYKPLLSEFGEGLRDYWDPTPKGSPPGFNAYCSGPGGDDKYYDDNAWLVLGFTEAYEVTRDPGYLQWARDTQNFVLSGWDDKLGGGIYWKLKHESKNTCSNAPTAAAALRLYQVGGDKDQLDWAQKIRTWTNANLCDQDGLYWDNVKLDGHIEKTKWTYNTALMIRTDVLLYQIKGDKSALREAEQSADAALTTWQDPKTGAFANDALFTHLLGEALLRLYDADGQIKYLNAVRRHAAYGDRAVRDAKNGGYWSGWHKAAHTDDERKSLIENAADARLLWLLARYPDVEELSADGLKAASHGDDSRAESLFRQAADSDTEAVEDRYRLWKVLRREKKAADAAQQGAILTELAKDSARHDRLAAVGWKAPPEPPVTLPAPPH